MLCPYASIGGLCLVDIELSPKKRMDIAKSGVHQAGPCMLGWFEFLVRRTTSNDILKDVRQPRHSQAYELSQDFP